VDKKILKKSYKILALSLAILAAAAVFLRRAGDEKTNVYKVTPLSPGFVSAIGGDYGEKLAKMPAPSEFQRLVVQPGSKPSLNVKTECRDAFYAVLVFEAGRDYRGDPSAAKFNSAFRCNKGEIVRKTIDLDGANLLPGDYYYFVADQGERDVWYNPRQGL
jgi:hypothetical protein